MLCPVGDARDLYQGLSAIKQNSAFECLPRELPTCVLYTARPYMVSKVLNNKPHAYIPTGSNEKVLLRPARGL